MCIVQGESEVNLVENSLQKNLVKYSLS